MNDFQRLIRQWKNQFNRWMESRGSGGSQPKRPNVRMCPVCGRFNEPRATVCEYCDSEIAPGGRPGRASLPGQQADAGPSLEPHTIILVVCIGFYLITGYLSGKAQGASFLSGLFGADNRTLIYAGSNFAPMTLLAGEPWRLFTYMFLHGSLLHIFFNMSAFGQLAPFVVESYGGWRFWLVSLVTGAFGGLVSALAAIYLGIGGNSVGFSGALFGFVGLMYVYFLKTGRMSMAERFKKFMIWFNVICIVLTVARIFPVDNAAHLGGMFAGIGLGYYFHSRAAGQVPPVVEKSIVIVCLAMWFWGLYGSFVYIDSQFFN